MYHRYWFVVRIDNGLPKLRSHIYHEVSMARVKMLRRLCARVATRAKTRAERRRHLDCSTSIRLPAALREPESKLRQRTVFLTQRQPAMAGKYSCGIGPPSKLEISNSVFNLGFGHLIRVDHFLSSIDPPSRLISKMPR